MQWSACWADEFRVGGPRGGCHADRPWARPARRRVAGPARCRPVAGRVPSGPAPRGSGRCRRGRRCVPRPPRRAGQQLREHERLAAFGGQGGQQAEEGYPVLEAGQAARLGQFGGRLPVRRLGRTRPGRRVPVAVDHRAARDGQRPGTGRGAALEAAQAAERAGTCPARRRPRPARRGRDARRSTARRGGEHGRNGRRRLDHRRGRRAPVR